MSQKVRRLRLQTRRAVHALTQGHYRSVFKGSGLLFENVREYEPGDDIRTIDWNVTARVGRPYVKRYQEERELNIILVCDLSKSMFLSSESRTKHHVLTELAAILALTGAAHQDRVGLIQFHEQVVRYRAPNKGQRHSLQVLRDILTQAATGVSSNLAGSLDLLQRVVQRRSIIFILSDFLTTGYEIGVQKLGHRHDVIALRIHDPVEESWPDAGLVTWEDAETGEQLLIDTSDLAARNAYHAQTQRLRHEWREICRNAHADTIEISTRERPIQTLLRFFAKRERRVPAR